jgi:hypothetical protein
LVRQSAGPINSARRWPRPCPVTGRCRTPNLRQGRRSSAGGSGQ